MEPPVVEVEETLGLLLTPLGVGGIPFLEEVPTPIGVDRLLEATLGMEEEVLDVMTPHGAIIVARPIIRPRIAFTLVAYVNLGTTKRLSALTIL